MWPLDAESLMSAQRELAEAHPEPWRPPIGDLLVGGCWVCFPRGLRGRGGAGDAAWVAAVVMRGDQVVAQEVRRGVAGAPYSPGLLALRLGRLMDEAVRALRDAAGRAARRRHGARPSARGRSRAAPRGGAGPADRGHHAPATTGPRRLARRSSRCHHPAPDRRRGGRLLDADARPASGRSRCIRGGGSISTPPLRSWPAPPGSGVPLSRCVARAGSPAPRASPTPIWVSVVAASVSLEMRGST